MSDATDKQFWPVFSLRKMWAFKVLAPAVVALSVYVASILNKPSSDLFLLVFALVLSFIWLDIILKGTPQKSEKTRSLTMLKQVYENDLLPAVICSETAEIVWKNERAMRLASSHNFLSEYLQPYLPNASATSARIARQAFARGEFTEKLSGVTGDVEIHVKQYDGHALWRFNINQAKQTEVEHTGAMLTVGRNGTVLYMNPSARELIGERVTSLDRLFTTDLPILGKVQALKTSRGMIKVTVEMESLRADRNHVFIKPVIHDTDGHTRALKDLPIPLMFVDEQGLIKEANTASLNLLGYSDLTEKGLSDVFDSHGVMIAEWIEKACKARSPVNAEFLRVRGATKETFVQVALKRLESGSDTSLVAVLTDATKLKSLEAQFVQSQKMQAIGQLAGGVAHDFNNLLTAISGHCDLMLLRHDPGDQDYADLMQIHQNANRAAGLVSQLLAFSRKQTLQLEYLDLRNTLSDLTHLLNRLVGETVVLTLSHDPVLRAVRADKRQLEQVIMNLVVNARDAMPKGGEIKIQTEGQTLTAPLKRDRVTVPAGDYTVVRVSDQGVGIDEDALQKIFEPFYTTKRVGEGTGLGLSTAYGIVKQTGGFIFADSEVGQGTCFSLLFPASENAGVARKKTLAEAKSKPTELCSGVVLLVEDEAPVRAFASRALSLRGFDVIEADSGEAALSLLKDNSLAVDIFVTDVVMPGMDGPTWVKEAMKERPEVNVVFISGYAEGAFKGANPLLSKSVFLPKPFSLADLTSTVQNQLTD